MDGTKHRTWRSITDVAAECRIEWERRRRTQEAPAAAEDRNSDSAAASSSFEPRSRAGGREFSHGHRTTVIHSRTRPAGLLA